MGVRYTFHKVSACLDCGATNLKRGRINNVMVCRECNSTFPHKESYFDLLICSKHGKVPNINGDGTCTDCEVNKNVNWKKKSRKKA